MQYPQDFASSLFLSYKEHFESDSHIVAHRHHNLMYYTYMKKLSEDKGNAYFGISILINGLETDSIKSLFRLFERVFQQIVSEGELLTINPSGDIVAKSISFGTYSKTFNRYSGLVKDYIEEGQENFFTIRPVNYASSDEDFSVVSISEGDIAIRQKLCSVNKLFITKSNKTISSGLNGLAVRIENLSEQLEYQIKRNAELEEKLNGSSSSDIKWKSLAVSMIVIILAFIIVVAYSISSGIISINL